jgi:hypothetical protein
MSGKLIVKLNDSIVIESATNYVANRRAKIEFNVYRAVETRNRIVYAWAGCIRAYTDSLVWSTFDNLDSLPIAPYINVLETEQCHEVLRLALSMVPGSH